MKIIAITPRIYLHKSYNEIRDALDIQWVNLLTSIDFLPLMIPTGVDYSTYLNNFKLSGIIFSGGNSLSKLDNNILSSMRDKKEKKLLEYSISRKIPTFGVCRGMQLIADYFGCEFIKSNNHVVKNHKINILDGNILVKNIRKEVNSYHNYAITNVSKKFNILAQAKDKTIEAIYSKEYKIFAQMWHPERESPFNQNDIKLIKHFFND